MKASARNEFMRGQRLALLGKEMPKGASVALAHGYRKVTLAIKERKELDSLMRSNRSVCG